MLVAVLLVSAVASAQVSFYVEAPSGNEGGYEISNADGADWASPDMSDPANVVSGTMCLAEDSLACDPLTNGTDLTGKIAVVYRGACEFGFKALQAQNEGAIACIIVNHSPGVIPMGGGAEGLNVTIPVIMISNADGALLYDDFASCSSTAIIGNFNGYFENNLRMTKGGTLRPASYGRIHALSDDDSEFAVDAGTWVYNFGQAEDDEVVVTLEVSVNGGVIWTESSDAVSVPAGDSLFVAMPTFSQTDYVPGRHTMSYTVTGSAPDGFTADNTAPADFNMGNAYSYSRLNDEDKAWYTNHTSAAEFVGEQNICILFQDANADRVAVSAFDFSGTHFTETITDYEIEIAVYEWGDDYAGTNTTFLDFSELDSEAYSFEEGDDDQIVSLAFDTPVELESDVRYAFCLRHSNEDLQLGFDNKTDYTWNTELTDAPIFPYWDEAESFPLLFGADLAPAFSVQMIDLTLGTEDLDNERDITPYPNPVAETLSIPFPKEVTGNSVLSIFSLDGRLVSKQSVNITSSVLKVNVSTIANGNYVFNLQFDDNTQSTFNVAINR